MCGPFALAMGIGERKSPYSVSDLRETPLKVEDLNDARTPLVDFVNSLQIRPAKRNRLE